MPLLTLPYFERLEFHTFKFSIALLLLMSDSYRPAIAFFLLGMAFGLYLPQFTENLEFLNTYLGVILFIIAVVLLVKK